MEKSYRDFENEEVEKIFLAYPGKVRSKMYDLRDFILDIGEGLEQVKGIQETLKWGEPSFITTGPKTGTTIRIDWKEKHPDYYAVYVNCQTSLIESFKVLYPDSFIYEGTRAIQFPLYEDLWENRLKVARLREFITMAMTYHLDK